jgi:hypothetical protein
MGRSNEHNLNTRIQELTEKINQFSSTPLQPEYIILDDVDVMNILKISKRKLFELRQKREIEFYPTGEIRNKDKRLKNAISEKSKGKRAGKIYYTLRGVLNYILRYTVAPLYSQINLAS